MSSSTLYVIGGIIIAIGILVGAAGGLINMLAQLARNRESALSSKRSTATIVGEIGESENRLSAKTDEGVDKVTQKLDDMKQLLEKNNNKLADELRETFPYGYVLFGGRGDDRVYVPFVGGDNHIDADWNLAIMDIDSKNKMFFLRLPHIRWSYGPTREPIGTAPYTEVGGEYVLGELFGMSLLNANQIGLDIEIINDKGPQPIWALGLLKRE